VNKDFRSVAFYTRLKSIRSSLLIAIARELCCVEGTYSFVSRATMVADTEHSGLAEQQVLVKSIKGMILFQKFSLGLVRGYFCCRNFTVGLY